MSAAPRTLVACALSIMLVGTACSAAQPSALPEATASPPVAASPATSPSPSVGPTATATATPTPTIAPSASPSPSAPSVTTVTGFVWTVDKPLVLRGVAGTTEWTNVLFAAKTVSLRWQATPADAKGCSFRYQLTSPSLSKVIKEGGKAKTAKPIGGSRDLTIKYGDGKVTVTTDCSAWLVKVTPTGHPGIAIKRDTEQTVTKASTVYDLNRALAESQVDWWLTNNYRYTGTSRPRVVSVKVTVDLTYELPSWTPPAEASPTLVEDWNTALAGMKRHEEGEVAIAVQAAGRFIAAASKTSFTSVKAMKKYFDQKGDKYLDWARDRSRAYDEATGWGETQGAYLP